MMSSNVNKQKYKFFSKYVAKYRKGMSGNFHFWIFVCQLHVDDLTFSGNGINFVIKCSRRDYEKLAMCLVI